MFLVISSVTIYRHLKHDWSEINDTPVQETEVYTTSDHEWSVRTSFDWYADWVSLFF